MQPLSEPDHVAVKGGFKLVLVVDEKGAEAAFLGSCKKGPREKVGHNAG